VTVRKEGAVVLSPSEKRRRSNAIYQRKGIADGLALDYHGRARRPVVNPTSRYYQIRPHCVEMDLAQRDKDRGRHQHSILQICC